jgi:hypothetical protein
MAQVTVAWLMSEDHRANREEGRADPNDQGGLIGVGFMTKITAT